MSALRFWAGLNRSGFGLIANQEQPRSLRTFPFVAQSSAQGRNRVTERCGLQGLLPAVLYEVAVIDMKHLVQFLVNTEV